MTNVPNKPEQRWLDYILANWKIDVEQGKIFNSKGEEIGYPNERGYFRVTLNGGSGTRKMIKRCHLVWWKAKGEWPKSELDHEDRDKANDKIGNLRESNRIQQSNNTYDKSQPYGSPWRP